MKKEDLRIVFMGTPEFAVGTLRRLVEDGYNIIGVVTQPDRPVGRHQDTLKPSAVKEYALQHHLPVLQPEKMKDPQFVEQLKAWHADLQVVVAFRMLPEVVWSMPRFGTFNVHAALLPQYRGAAPVNWAIINGETETGVTTFFLDRDIDTGRIILQKTFPIGPEDNAETVYNGLMQLGAEAAEETVDRILEGDGKTDSIPQDELPSANGAPLHAAPKIFKDTCRIDWGQPAQSVHDFIRGLSPVPGAWTILTHRMDDEDFTSPDDMNAEKKDPGKVLKVYDSRLGEEKDSGTEPGSLYTAKGKLYVACRDRWLDIRTLQMEGKKRMDAASFLNGNRDLDDKHCL